MHDCRNLTPIGSDENFEDFLDLGVVDDDCQAPVPEPQGLREAKPLTVDSGAAESVADPDDIPEVALEPSAGSRAGRGYLGAGPNQRIPNLGQVRVRRVAEME